MLTCCSHTMPVGRRRLLPVLFVFTIGIVFFYFSPLFSLPSLTFKAPFGSPSAQAKRVQEIHGLLHFVTAYPDKLLVPLSDLGAPIDPTEPIDLRVYGEDSEQDNVSAVDWERRVDDLDRDTPLVVFSKVVGSLI